MEADGFAKILKIVQVKVELWELPTTKDPLFFGIVCWAEARPWSLSQNFTIEDCSPDLLSADSSCFTAAITPNVDG